MSRLAPLSLAVLFAAAVPVNAQRGRGRSEATLERISSYFVDAQVPPATEAGKDRFAGLALVIDAKENKHPVFLYVFDSSIEEPKREGFDKIVFGSEEVGVTLRCFRCARVDIAGDAEAQAKWGKKLPLFLAYDDQGRPAGEVSLPGYKAATSGLLSLLDKAIGARVKPTLDTFVKDYREVVRELENLEGKRRVLEGRRAKADDKKKEQLAVEARELDAEEVKLLTTEKEVLARGKLPPRDPTAKRIVVEQGRGR
jgi:hypothetical protein